MLDWKIELEDGKAGRVNIWPTLKCESKRGGFNFTRDWIQNFKEYVSIFAVLQVLKADEWVVGVMVSLSILGAFSK